MSNQPVVRLEPPVFVVSKDGSNIQFLMIHPVDGSDFTFEIVDGQGMIKDAHVLKCLMTHPKRDDAHGSGGFTLIGKDRELNVIYEKAMGVALERNPIDEKNARIAELEAALKSSESKVKDLTPVKAGDGPKK